MRWRHQYPRAKIRNYSVAIYKTVKNWSGFESKCAHFLRQSNTYFGIYLVSRMENSFQTYLVSIFDMRERRMVLFILSLSCKALGSNLTFKKILLLDSFFELFLVFQRKQRIFSFQKINWNAQKNHHLDHHYI